MHEPPASDMQPMGSGDSAARILLLSFCWLQVLLSIAALVAVAIQVENVIGFGPAIAVGGFILAIVGVCRVSWQLVFFGLVCPVATAFGAFMISAFTMAPNDARIPVFVILSLATLLLLTWALVATACLRTARLLQARHARPALRFSLRALLIATTCVCLIAVVMRQLQFSGEMIFFTTYGIGVLALAIVVGLWFGSRARDVFASAKQAEVEVKPATAHTGAPLYREP